jgi:N-acetylglucosaminyldiphosphoundecaprenol N-acetyl-beta-D-mannosaminyltransferase
MIRHGLVEIDFTSVSPHSTAVQVTPSSVAVSSQLADPIERFMSKVLVAENLPNPSLQLVVPRPEFERADIEGIGVDIFPTLESMLDRVVADIRHPKQARIFSINVHGANMAKRIARFSHIMSSVETMICDGVGIKVASRLLPGQTIPCRHAAGDYMPALLERLAEERLTAFFLAGEPGVAERAIENLAKKVPHHTVLGCHHGYILKDKALEAEVIDTINRLQPDILFIGFGMPLQEYWIEDNMHRLNVRAFFPFGATLDYLSNKVSRCPSWLGQLGLEWLYRFLLEPGRMFHRYIVGNPEFMLRILALAITQRVARLLPVPGSREEIA